MNQKGKTAKQIRQGIIAGEWKQVDLRNCRGHTLTTGFDVYG